MPGGIVSTAAAARSKKELNIFGLTRETFQRWRRDLRPARLAGLFLFEFVVVLLGVLAAQWVADWADDRRLAREAAVQYAQARQQSILAATVQKYWSQVGPCLRERAKAVARAASAGETMTSATIGRPALPMVQMPSWDEDVRRAAIARYGQDRMDAIEFFEGRTQIMTETMIRIRDAWATFALLDPANGPPSDIDRANVRAAAISVMDYVRLLGYNDSAAAMDALGVPRADWSGGELQDTAVDACGLIKDWQ